MKKLLLPLLVLFFACKKDEPVQPTPPANPPIDTTLTSPLLINPPAGDSSINKRPVFVWTKIKNAISYDLQVSVFNNFPGTNTNEVNTSDTIFSFNFDLSANPQYWRVRSVRQGMVSAWSETRIVTLYDTLPSNINLSGDLSTQTLNANIKYTLIGQVFVRNGQILTIPPGTIIFGDKQTTGTLIIDKGGQLIAVGTQSQPIVFTSNQATGSRDRGDWGGIVIVGNAQINQPVSSTFPAIPGITPSVLYGSNSSADNTSSSGSLKYVRIEFGGFEIGTGNSTGGLSLGGVGSGTVIDYVQVSYGIEDGFKWFGGTVNAKHLVSFANSDDDFSAIFGWQGNVQFGLAVRYPGFSSADFSKSLDLFNESFSNQFFASTPVTTGTFSNLTVVGPIRNGNTTASSNYLNIIDLRNNVAASIANSIFAGFPRGLRIVGQSTYNQYPFNGVLLNNTLLTPITNAFTISGSFLTASAQDVENLWNASNSSVKGPMSDSLFQANGLRPEWFFNASDQVSDYPVNPNFTTIAGSAGTTDFNNNKFNEASRANFFDKTVTYRGAFGTTDWTDGWTEFRPQTKVY